MIDSHHEVLATRIRRVIRQWTSDDPNPVPEIGDAPEEPMDPIIDP